MKRKISLALVLCLLCSLIPFGAMTAVAANSVDAQFWAADNGGLTIYVDDSPSYNTENFTEGTASLQLEAKEDNPNFVMFLTTNPVDITGATHLVFDVWCQKDNQLDGSDGWTDLYAWSEAAKGSMGWDEAQPYANATAAGNANYNDEKQQAFKACYAGLKAGWNTVTIPLDATVTDGQNVAIWRLRFANVSNMKKDEVILFDDFRFVDADTLANVVPDRAEAKKVIAKLAQGLAKLDVAEALTAYNALTDAQKAYVPADLLAQAEDLKTGVDVQFRSLDTKDYVGSYFHDRDGNNDAVFVDAENYLEGTAAVGGVIKADRQDIYLFLQNNGNAVDASGAAYLTMDVYVTKDGLFDGAEQYWSDVRGDDPSHANQWGEYDNPAVKSMPDNNNGIRTAMTGLKKGWNHVVVALDAKVTATELVSMRLRLTGGANMTNCTVGEEVIFDDIRLVSADVLENVIPKRNAAKDVTVLIRALPATISLGDEQAANDAKAAYDAVDPAYQSVVIGVDKLNAAVARIAELKENAASQEDTAAAAAVDSKIEAIGTVTVDSEAAITEARAAYDALTDTQKGLVTKLNTLIAAEEALVAAKKYAADKAAADAVSAKIAALPTVDTVAVEDEAAVKEVEAAYNALTTDQKNLVVGADAINALKAKIAELKLNQDVDPEGFVVDGKLDEFYKENDGGMTVFHYSSQNGDIDTFYANGGWDMYFDEVDHDVDFWTAYDETYMYFYVRSFDTDLNNTGDGNRNDSIALYLDPDYMSRSISSNPEGHFYVQTDDPNQGDMKFRLHGHDLSLDDMSPNPKVFMGNLTVAQYLSDPNNFNAFYFDEDQDGNNDGYGFEVRIPRCEDESNCYAVNIACGSYREDYSQQYTYSFGKSWWMDYSSMVLYEFNDDYNPFFNDGPYVDPNQEAAKAVDALIDAIPDPVTRDAADEIQAARDAFDALTPLQKALVMGLEKLEKAEEDLAKLPDDGTVRGDVDGDGKTSAADALEVLKSVVGKVQLTDQQKAVADLDGDGNISATDALVILRIVVGKE